MQLSLSTIPRPLMVHGGELAKGKRKTARPIATKRSMHLTLRAHGRGMHAHAKEIQECWQQLAKANLVRVYEFSNNDNHLHFLIRAKHRAGFKNCLRALAGRIAQLVTNAAKGRKAKSAFWAVPPFTRIVEWGKAYQAAKAYVIQNRLEAEGIIPYQSRKRPPKPQRAAERLAS